MTSSASTVPARTLDVFSTRLVTSAGSSGATRGGYSLCTHDSRRLDLKTVSAAITGETTSSAPARTRSGSGIARPHATAAAPSAVDRRPRVIRQPGSPGHA